MSTAEINERENRKKWNLKLILWKDFFLKMGKFQLEWPRNREGTPSTTIRDEGRDITIDFMVTIKNAMNKCTSTN